MNEAFRHNKQRKTTTGLVPPSLKAKLQSTITKGYNKVSSALGDRTISGYVSTDVALESALLSLGRCSDLVRPAGKLTSRSVTQEEWRDAQRQLEHFLDLMQRACDPDGPLPANQWGVLTLADNTIDDTIEVDPVNSVDNNNEMLDLADLFFAGDIGMDDSME